MGTPIGYRFGQFRLFVDERLLYNGESAVPIPARAFDVLVVLVERAGFLVTKEELLTRVWAGAIVEEANLAVAVSTLRRTIGHHWIETVPKHGYRFSAAVQHLDRGELPGRWRIGRADARAYHAGLLIVVILCSGLLSVLGWW